MTEATWGDDAKTPEIDWRMSAALETVPRGDEDLAEVTSLDGAVRAWTALDPEHRSAAELNRAFGAALVLLCLNFLLLSLAYGLTHRRSRCVS